MPRLRLRWLLLLLGGGALAGCAAIDPPAMPPSEIAQPRHVDAPPEYTIAKQIRYSYTLHNSSDRLLPKAEFRTYAPVPQTSHQWVEKVSATQPYRSVRDALGNEMMQFEVEDFPPYGTKIISITVDLRMTDSAAAIREADIGRFKQPEAYIESNDPRLAQFARTLGQGSPAGSMRMAYEWVAANIRSETYIPEDRGAAYALTTRRGDCTEFAYLLAALGRANDIPVRPVGGYVFKGNAIVKAVDYHNWAEFFVDGRWQLADAQKKAFMQHQVDYVAMRIIAAGAESALGEAQRYSFAGAGLEVRMN